jgi:sugar lactone lactonase YvrE
MLRVLFRRQKFWPQKISTRQVADVAPVPPSGVTVIMRAAASRIGRRDAVFDPLMAPYLRPFPRRAGIAALVASAALLAGASSALAQVPCPGAQPACPWIAASQIGQSANGVLRFPQAVAIGADGSVYVGDQGSHVVQVFTPQGQFLRTIGAAGRRPGELSAVGALAVADDGSLLVADGRNRIDRFAPGGALLNSFGSSGSGVGQFLFGGGRGNDAGAGGGLATASGLLYVADSGNNRIQRFTVQGTNASVILPPGELSHPKGLAVRGTRLYIADDQRHRVLVTDTGGRFLRSVGAGSGSRPGQLNFPYGVALDPQGRLFVADNLNHRIVRFSTASTGYAYKARWGSYGRAPGQLAFVRGIASDRSGNVYVANTGNDRIDVFDRGGRLLRSFGTSGRTEGQFNTPSGVAADSNGVRAVTDAVNGRIELLGADGSIISSWGSPNPGPTILPRPVAVAFDVPGNAYVVDQRRGVVVVFSRATGRPVRTIGSQGSGAGQMRDPSAIALDGAGNVYVADTGNDRILRFTNAGGYLGAITAVGRGLRGIAVTPDGSRVYGTVGNFVRIWSAAGAEIDEFGGTGRGLGKLNTPAQLTLDQAGHVWVADRGNNRIQQFGPNGERLQTVGTRGTGPGQFTKPTGVSVDCRGTLTVTDTDNNRVQQFTLLAPVTPPGSMCASLPAPARPPAPKLPTGPTPDGPVVSLRALRTSGLLTQRTLPVRVGCDTGCELNVRASLTPQARPPRGRKRVTVNLRAVNVTLQGGDSRLLRLRVSRAQARTVSRALRGRRGLSATVTVEAEASAGAPTTVSREYRATR